MSMSVCFYVEGDRMVFSTLLDKDNPLTLTPRYRVHCSVDCVVRSYGHVEEYLYEGTRNDEARNSDAAIYYQGRQCSCGAIMESAFINSSSSLEYQEL